MLESPFQNLLVRPALFHARDDIFVFHSEKTHAAAVETAPQLLHVVGRQTALGVRADLVEHAAEVNQPADFLGRTASGK